jgi:two-component system CheB/CheR fusion protein
MADATQPTNGAELPEDASFTRLLEKLHEEHGFDFREYKPASLARRINARMHQVRVDSCDAYLAYLDRHPDEHVALFNTILINVTTFFRDPEAWRVLGDEVVPRLLEEVDSRGLRVWSAGCSSGEEAYSLAMLIGERLGADAQAPNVKIYATDVDEDALQTARAGLYRVEDLKDVPAPYVDRYFDREGQMYRFRREFRRWCIFGRHNVAQDPPLSHIDLLVCRNVLIYFTSDLQGKILARFHYSVRERGFLFLGRAESLLARSRWFVPFNVKWRIFQRTTTPAPTVVAAAARDDTTGTAAAARANVASGASRLQTLFEAMPSGVFMIDATDTVLVWNETAGGLFDIPPVNAIGRNFRDLDVSYRVEGLRARIEEVKASQIPARLEQVSYLRRNGQATHADFVIVPIVEAEHVTAVAVYVDDVTDAIRVKEQVSRLTEQHATAIEELQSTNEELETTNEELQSTNEELETTNEELQSTNEELETTVEELQAANAELAALNTELGQRTGELKRVQEYHLAVLSSLPAAIVVLDGDGAVTTWSGAAERLWGLRAEHATGRLLWTLPVGSDFARRMREAVPRVVASGRAETFRDVAITVPAGDSRAGIVQVAPLVQGAGETIGVSASFSLVEIIR